MNGMMKLRLSVTILFILMAIVMASAYLLVTIDDEEFVEEYNKLSENEQDTLSNFYNKLTDNTSLYAILGYMQYAIIIGLFLLMYKVWTIHGI